MPATGTGDDRLATRAAMARIVGQLSFALPLPLDVSWLAMAGWYVSVFFVAALGSLAPARVATKLTVREALGHV